MPVTRSRLVALSLCVLAGPPGIARGQAAPAASPASAALQVFLDCHAHCDFDHIRREIAYVSWVRDRQDAEVHLLLTTQGTGGGGAQYTMKLIGLRAFVGAAEEDFLVGVVGRLAEVKEPLRALAVFRLLAARHPRLQLAFVGDGALRRALEQAIAALPGEEARRVHMLGARADMAVVLDALDALLASSRSEGMPVALIEAAAAGLPVVARAVGGVPELVVHERTGYLGSSDDELAFQLSKLLEDPRAARAMGARARLRVTKTHAAETLATRLLELYQVVCAERAARGATR